MANTPPIQEAAADEEEGPITSFLLDCIAHWATKGDLEPADEKRFELALSAFTTADPAEHEAAARAFFDACACVDPEPADPQLNDPTEEASK